MNSNWIMTRMMLFEVVVDWRYEWR